MTNPYRAMCAELLQELCCHYRSWELKEGHCSDAMTRARALLDQPERQPPVAGEVAASLIELRSTVMGLDQARMYVAAKRVERAADLLQRQHPQPVAVSERLPGAEDCDEQGRCWLLTVEDEYPQWRLHSIEGAQPGGAMIWVPVDSSPGVMVDCFYTSHWLPATALPTPEAP